MEAKDYSIMHCRDGNLYITRSIGTDFRSKDSKCLSNEDLKEIKSWIKQNNEYVHKDAFIKRIHELLSSRIDYITYYHDKTEFVNEILEDLE